MYDNDHHSRAISSLIPQDLICWTHMDVKKTIVNNLALYSRVIKSDEMLGVNHNFLIENVFVTCHKGDFAGHCSKYYSIKIM